MTEYGLDPAYVVIDYVSEYAPHKHIIPTLAWSATNITGTMGSYTAHDSTPVDAEDMIDALVALLAPIAHTSTTYTQASVYTKPTPDDPAILERAKAYTTAGSSAASGVRKAVQATFNMKTVGAQPFKVVFLDYPHGTGQFDKQYPSSFSADAIALADALANPSNAWAGRDKTRVATFLTVTNTLNEALRKQYRMT